MSGRSINGSVKSLLGTSFAAAVFVDMELDTPLYFSNAAMDVTYGGKTWIGVQQLVVEDVSEGAQQAEQLRLTLPAVPNSFLGLALGTNIRGKRVSLYLGIMRSEDLAIMQMIPLWSGQLDQMPVAYGPENASVSVTAEHSAVAYARPKPYRYTDAEQRRIFGGDRCLEYLVNQSQTEDIWPSKEFFKK